MPEGREKSLFSRRNRRMRTRMYGGVGAGTDLLGQSPATRLEPLSYKPCDCCVLRNNHHYVYYDNSA